MEPKDVTVETVLEAAKRLGAKSFVLNSFKGAGYPGWAEDMADYKENYDEEQTRFLTILEMYIYRRCYGQAGK